MADTDERELGEKQMEAYALQDLEEAGMEKTGELFADAENEELVLVGHQGPVRYSDLLTEEEYKLFREIAEKKEPTKEEVTRGQQLLRLMMKRYPDGPGAE